MKRAIILTVLTLLSFTACNKPAAVEQAIETQLKDQKIDRVNVTYRDGVAVLDGYVNDETEHARARAIAQQTGGVKSVDDRVRVVNVEPGTPVTPNRTMIAPDAPPVDTVTPDTPGETGAHPSEPVDTGGILRNEKQRGTTGDNLEMSPASAPRSGNNTNGNTNGTNSNDTNNAGHLNTSPAGSNGSHTTSPAHTEPGSSRQQESNRK